MIKSEEGELERLLEERAYYEEIIADKVDELVCLKADAAELRDDIEGWKSDRASIEYAIQKLASEVGEG